MIHPTLQCSPSEYLRGSALNELESVDYMKKLLIKKQTEHAKLFKEISDIQDEINEALRNSLNYIEAADFLETAKKQNKPKKLSDELLLQIYLSCKTQWKAANKRDRQRIAVLFGNAVMEAMESAKP